MSNTTTTVVSNKTTSNKAKKINVNKFNGLSLLNNNDNTSNILKVTMKNSRNETARISVIKNGKYIKNNNTYQKYAILISSITGNDRVNIGFNDSINTLFFRAMQKFFEIGYKVA